MISINYVKKIGNEYIMNFYADTKEDLNNFDPNKNYMNYGKPLYGSVITIINDNEDVNYYLNESGVLVKIPINTEPSQDTLICDLTSSDIGPKTSYVIPDFSSTPSDVYYAVITNADGVDNNHLDLTYFEDEKEGNGWSGAIGTGDVAGLMSIDLYEDGEVAMNVKNPGGDFTNLTVKIYKVVS